MNVLLLWEPGAEAQALVVALARAQCTVLGPYPPSGGITEVMRLSQAELIMIQSDAAERDTLEHIVVSSQSTPRPIVMVTDGEGTHALDTAHTARLAAAAGISAYVSVGIAPERIASVLQLATAQFEGMSEMSEGKAALRDELVRVRQELAERKQIERAKGWLMQRFALSEEEAYKRLRMAAMQRRTTMGAVATELIVAMST